MKSVMQLEERYTSTPEAGQFKETSHGQPLGFIRKGVQSSDRAFDRCVFIKNGKEDGRRSQPAADLINKQDVWIVHPSGAGDFDPDVLLS